MRETTTLIGLLRLSGDIGDSDILEWLGYPTEMACGICGQNYLKKFEAINGRCERCRKAYLGDQEKCPQTNCHHGWHWEEDGDCSQQWIAKERCSLTAGNEAISKWDSGYSGAIQTFSSFNRGFELAAYDATEDWADNADGQDTLALVKSDHASKNTGCGKTHLLRAAGREMTKRGLWVEIIGSGALTDVIRMRASFTERAEAESRVRRWVAADVLVFDDIGNEETVGPITGSFLAHVFDQRLDKPLAFASNLSCDGIIGKYGEAMASRFLGGSRKPVMRGSDFRGRDG